MAENDAPLSEDEFNQLAREGSIILPADRDEIAIHEYLVKTRGWRTVFTMRAPEEDVNGAHVRISTSFD